MSTSNASKTTGSGGESKQAADGNRQTVTFTVPRAATATAKVVQLPIRTAQRVLPAKGGLPLYIGLGAMGLAGVLEWPVAVGVGIGYAVLRRPALSPAPEGDGKGGTSTS